jgi:gamma-glutamyltranspeptidase/glutathione hydrolase
MQPSPRNAALGLMEPVSNGIGGDLFAIVYQAKDNKLYGLNGSGRSPLWPFLRANEGGAGQTKSRNNSTNWNAPISVPGCVDAWAELHKRFGKLSLGDDLSGAIHYAEEGFPGFRVDRLVLEPAAFRSTKVSPAGSCRPTPLDGKGRTPAKGDIFKNPGTCENASGLSVKKGAMLITKVR